MIYSIGLVFKWKPSYGVALFSAELPRNCPGPPQWSQAWTSRRSKRRPRHPDASGFLVPRRYHSRGNLMEIKLFKPFSIPIGMNFAKHFCHESKHVKKKTMMRASLSQFLCLMGVIYISSWGSAGHSPAQVGLQRQVRCSKMTYTAVLGIHGFPACYIPWHHATIYIHILYAIQTHNLRNHCFILFLFFCCWSCANFT